MITLTRVFLRSQLGFLSAWIIPLLAILAVTPSALQANVEQANLTQLGESLRPNLGMRVFNGTVPDPFTYGSFTVWRLWFWLVLLGGIMAVLFAVRLTRQLETQGTLEIIKTTGIPRYSAPLAALTAITFTCVGFGAGCTLVLFAQSAAIPDFKFWPSLLFGAVTGLAIGTYGAVTVLLSQFAIFAHTTRRLGLLFLGCSYVLWAIAEIYEVSWLRWFSPLGWGNIIAPLSQNHVWPLLVFVLVFIVVCIPSVLTRRDINAGWLHSATAATPHAVARGYGPIALPLRLHRVSVFWWMASIILLGVFFFSLTGEMSRLIAANPQQAQVMQQMFPNQDFHETYIHIVSNFVAILLGCLVVHTVLGLAREEKHTTLALDFTAGNSRSIRLGVQWFIALAASIITVMIVGFSGGASLVHSSDALDNNQWYSTTFWAIADQVPALVALAGIAVALLGASGRFAWCAWLPLAWSGMVTYFGEVLNFPDWLLDISVFAWTAHDRDSVMGTVLLVCVGLLAVLLGAQQYRQRDVLC